MIGVLSVGLITSCSSEVKTDENTNNQVVENNNEQHEEEEIITFYGKYELSDMIPVTDGKILTAQDEKYINDSKERTIGNTFLTFNEDGTFERVYPHPSGNGTTNTWTGTFAIDETAGTLLLNAEMNGKTMPMNFTIEEKTDSKLSIKTDFGQIFMTYVYTR